MTRKEINDKIKINCDAIADLQRQNRDLEYESLMTSDKDRWYIEKEEAVNVRGGRKKSKITKMSLIGRIHWIEFFTDEDTGQRITVERSRVVKSDGVWFPLATTWLPNTF